MHNWGEPAAGGGDPRRRRPLTGGNVETATLIGMGVVLAIWLYGFSTLLLRKGHGGRRVNP